jgi:SPP1 gp7 family putative phage head morphogenesis protein
MGFIQETARKIAGIEEKPYEPVIYSQLSTQEAMKGVVKIEEPYKIDVSKVGEDHPFDFTVVEGLYKKFGLITGIIDKFVDFVIGVGYEFNVVGEVDEATVEKANEIISDFLYDSDFEMLLRAWVKEALLKGNGFMEFSYTGEVIDGMKVLNANQMYVKRDKFGVIEGYNQVVSKLDDPIAFKPTEIAHLRLNVVGADAYGLGIVFPAINTINNLIGCENDMHMLISRKANVPFHVQIGDLASKRFPSDAAITGFGQKLEWLHNKHEWVTGPDINIKTIDFGNIGEKFDSPIKYDTDMLFFTFQVPEVLMGRGSIPEGLAKVQLEAFMMRIQSIQAEIEKIVEKQIIRNLLLSNNIDVEIEMEWGKSSNADRDAEIMTLNSVAGKYGEAVNTLVEEKIVELLGLDEERYEELKDIEQKNKEVARRDDFAKQGMAPPVPTNSKYGKGLYAKVCEHCLKESMATKDLPHEEITMEKWLGFSYAKVKSWILNAVARDSFKDLKADTAEQLAQGYLTRPQISKLRQVYLQAFDEGKSVDWVDKKIREQNIIPALLKKEGDSYVEQLSSEVRSYVVARTESTRLAFEGNKDYYRASGVQEVRWIASNDACPDCEELNGQRFELSEVEQPAHVMCRCTTAAVTELDD